MGASPPHMTRARPFPWGPSRGAGHPMYFPACPRVPVQGRFPSVPSGGHVGHAVYPPACLRLPVPGRLSLVPSGGPDVRDPPGEVPPALARPNWIEPPPAVGKESGAPRRRGGGSDGGRGLAADRVVGAPPGGPAGWKRCTSRLRSTFHGRLPRGSVSVWRWAVMSWPPWSVPRGASGPGGGATVGGGLAGVVGACVPAAPPVSPAGRPTFATWGLASGPFNPGGRGAGPVGSATAWGIGRTALSTTGIGGRALPGK